MKKAFLSVIFLALMSALFIGCWLIDVETPPEAPTALVVTAGDGQLTVRWTAVDGATAYEVWGGTGSSIESAAKYGTGTSAFGTITGLTNGTTYYIWVRAKKDEELSDFSPRASGVPNPIPAPSAPTAPVVTAGAGQLTVRWTAVAGATAYEVWTGTNSASAAKYGADVTGLYTTINGLTSGTTYYVWVKAKNSGGISDFSPRASGVPNPIPATIKYAKELWGEWLRMDTGETWYINSQTIKVGDSIKTVSLTKQSERVVKVTDSGREYYLYASRVANTSFTGKIASLEQASLSARALGGIGGIGVTISNLGDQINEISTTTNADGNFTAEGIIPGDEYEVTPEGGTPTTVTSTGDGDNVGTITIVNGVNFKTTIKPKSASLDMMQLYATMNSYDFTMEIENTGTEDCTAAIYKLLFDDSLISSSASTPQIMGTVESGKKKSFDVTLRSKTILTESEFKKISVEITDTIANKTWEDSVSLKFNNAPVNFNIKSNGTVRGVIISPSAKAYPFTTSGNSVSITLPWSSKDYLVVFSGATADTEVIYSLGINVMADSNFAGFSELGKYEPNNTETEATPINMQENIMAYLHKNDIDYYKINLGQDAPKVKSISMLDFATTDVNGNKDGHINPSESAYLDIRVKNNTNTSMGGTVTLSTASQYVTIDNGTATIGTMNAEYYATLTAGSTSSSSVSLLSSDSLAKAFKFTVAETCPIGTELPFTVTFTDSWGNSWTDTLSVTVEQTRAAIAINTPVTDNYGLKEIANGNGDNKVNPRESFYLDIRIKNSGTSNVLGLSAALSTASQYVTIDNGTATIGTMNAKYYATLTAGSTSSSSVSLLSSDSLAKAFKFTVAETCPIGTELPFTVTFTDSWGNSWTDTLSVTVEQTGAAIAINTPVTSNIAISEISASPENYYLDIRLKNSGTSKALGLSASIVTSNSYVTLSKSTTDIGDISARYFATLTSTDSSSSGVSLLNSSYISKAFKFTLNGGYTAGMDIPFTVTFTDSWGNSWTDTLTIPGTKIALTSTSKSQYSGDSDSLTNPGESWYISINFNNSGMFKAIGLSAELSTSSTYITLNTSSVTIGDMNASSSSSKSEAFRFTVASDCPTGTIPFTVTFRDSGGNSWAGNLSITVQ